MQLCGREFDVATIAKIEGILSANGELPTANSRRLVAA
jgi:hypothetical protein